MNDEEIRLSVVHLLRAYFDKSPSVDPLNDERVVDISRDHISALADIILYTSNPIYYYELKDKTYNDAVAMLANSTLRFKLPEPLMGMIAYRHSQNNIMGNEIVKIADDIVYSAKKSEDFWRLQRDGELEWGVCPREDVNLGYGRWNNNNPINPYGIEGWVPAIIEKHPIWIRRNQFDMYPGRWDPSDSGKEDVLEVNISGHNSHWSRFVTREVLNKCPSAYGITSDINEDDWIQVNIRQQRTWIYYNPSKLSLLPKSSIVDSYIKITLTASFPHIQGCTFFAERNPHESVFLNYPRSIFTIDRPLFVNDDLPSHPIPDPTRQIIVTGNGDTNYRFQETYITSEGNTTHYENIYWRRTSENHSLNVCSIQSILNTLNYNRVYIHKLFTINTFVKLINKISVDTITDQIGRWILWKPYTYVPSYNQNWKYLEITKLLSIYWQFDPSHLSELDSFISDFQAISRNPTSVDEEEEEEEEEVDLSGVPAPAPEPHRRVVRRDASGSIARPTQLCKRIRDLIVADIISKGDECSITMEPLTAENLAITSCFHFFDKDAIGKWFEEKDTCPQCRERTTVFA